MTRALALTLVALLLAACAPSQPPGGGIYKGVKHLQEQP